MGGVQSIQKISFQDMNTCIQRNYSIISVMKQDSCVIEGTIPIQKEEEMINRFYESGNFAHPIVIYGCNDCDENIVKKYRQLKELGFTKVYVYPGGMFEWLLLQDIFTDKHFHTSSKELNILKYKSENFFD